MSQTASLLDETKIVQLIVFHVGNEEFAVPIGDVREIIKAGVVTPVPDSPDFIVGLINVRGEIVATIDLRARLLMPREQACESKHTIIIKHGDNLFGLMVDEVTEVLRIPQSEIKQAPDLMANQHEEYLHGVLPLGTRLIVLLDLGHIFSEPELARWAEVNRRTNEATQVHKRRRKPNSLGATSPPNVQGASSQGNQT